MTLDELRGHVTDVLGTPLSDDQTLKELKSRVNGADLNQLLIAALSVAREQPSEQIAELERTLDASTQRRWRLEDEVLELREQIKRLAHKCETRSKRITRK